MSDPVPVLAAVTQGLYQVNYQCTSSQMPYQVVNIWFKFVSNFGVMHLRGSNSSKVY